MKFIKFWLILGMFIIPFNEITPSLTMIWITILVVVTLPLAITGRFNPPIPSLPPTKEEIIEKLRHERYEEQLKKYTLIQQMSYLKIDNQNLREKIENARP